MGKTRSADGNRNVFNGPGVPTAEGHLVKAQLVYKKLLTFLVSGLGRFNS
jgi:hypothetical protein